MLEDYNKQTLYADERSPPALFVNDPPSMDKCNGETLKTWPYKEAFIARAGLCSFSLCVDSQFPCTS